MDLADSTKSGFGKCRFCSSLQGHADSIFGVGLVVGNVSEWIWQILFSQFVTSIGNCHSSTVLHLTATSENMPEYRTRIWTGSLILLLYRKIWQIWSEKIYIVTYLTLSVANLKFPKFRIDLAIIL